MDLASGGERRTDDWGVAAVEYEGEIAVGIIGGLCYFTAVVRLSIVFFWFRKIINNRCLTAVLLLYGNNIYMYNFLFPKRFCFFHRFSDGYFLDNIVLCSCIKIYFFRQYNTYIFFCVSTKKIYFSFLKLY